MLEHDRNLIAMMTSDALFGDDLEPSGERSGDGRLDRVAAWFACQPDLQNRFSAILRRSIDEVLDGQQTGRYDLDAPNVAKTEKTYLGTKVEIICQAEFGLSRGSKLDYSVAGVDVDAKFSLTGAWMIPVEAMGHICLVMSADDAASSFQVGLVHIQDEVLTNRGNRDGKRSISARGRSAIHWMVRNGVLAPNVLLRLDVETRRRIESVPAGQQRVNQVFMLVQGTVVDRNVIATVARQLDAPKRVRDARNQLRAEGIIILGHQNDSPAIARMLGLEVPVKGTWVAAPLAVAQPGDTRPGAIIEGKIYVVAKPGEDRVPVPTTLRF
ncbi:NaeI family type II restriction endonuclease [Streptomyces sp. G-G2]|uniref:NaeI family type II restriction endonuclease n=1 Tax=Streptomyces sp. G-G2 TaxID=3046201 RepID=UPI0024BB91A8|nr:NaeI family type II restriction endonuclease [Streptomyces sp. G-G2]MDJ0379642.1 NaeI family type II restriction endonuclease [Streptomyces sp. G-G2]